MTMTRQQVQHLKRFVWPEAAVRPPRIYAVLDGARDPAIHDLVHRSYREKSCLFAGDLEPEVERAAPFLLELQQGDTLTDELLLRGWGDAWMVLLRSENSFRSVRRHLRTLLRVRSEDGAFLLFRFYDPRVLSMYLPTCTPQELATVYRDEITEWFCHAPGSTETTGYSVHDGTLLQRYAGQTGPA